MFVQKAMTVHGDFDGKLLLTRAAFPDLASSCRKCLFDILLVKGGLTVRLVNSLAWHLLLANVTEVWSSVLVWSVPISVPVPVNVSTIRQVAPPLILVISEFWSWRRVGFGVMGRGRFRVLQPWFSHPWRNKNKKSYTGKHLEYISKTCDYIMASSWDNCLVPIIKGNRHGLKLTCTKLKINLLYSITLMPLIFVCG